jgi:hypothetical protein
MWRRMALVRTDVSEEHIPSIIRITGIGELWKTLAPTSNRKPVLTRATLRHIPKDGILQIFSNITKLPSCGCSRCWNQCLINYSPSLVSLLVASESDRVKTDTLNAPSSTCSLGEVCCCLSQPFETNDTSRCFTLGHMVTSLCPVQSGYDEAGNLAENCIYCSIF